MDNYRETDSDQPTPASAQEEDDWTPGPIRFPHVLFVIVVVFAAVVGTRQFNLDPELVFSLAMLFLIVFVVIKVVQFFRRGWNQPEDRDGENILLAYRRQMEVEADEKGDDGLAEVASVPAGAPSTSGLSTPPQFHIKHLLILMTAVAVLAWLMQIAGFRFGLCVSGAILLFFLMFKSIYDTVVFLVLVDPKKLQRSHRAQHLEPRDETSLDRRQTGSSADDVVESFDD